MSWTLRFKGGHETKPRRGEMFSAKKLSKLLLAYSKPHLFSVVK